MNPLQSRKQLLIAESELNRAQLAADLAAVKADIRTLAKRAKKIGAIVSATVAVLAILRSFRRGRSANGGAKLSWLQTIFRGGGLISTIWNMFRPPSPPVPPSSGPDEV
jgi:hypothetical protein